VSEFAFLRFVSNNLLTKEEEQRKDEIVNLTEEALQARGIECDARISKLSEGQLREILEEVRKKLGRKRRRKGMPNNSEETFGDEIEGEEEKNVVEYIR
jgi:hypothetical protein